ncbi:MAG: homoserine kinase [Alphaproteobacteria bacterium]|nr:homoserine kinase [Alphaproteobacteria bacterium]
MKKTIRIKAPATVANVVCAFDVMGFCLQEPYDIITLSLTEKNTIDIEHLDDFNLPTDPKQNLAGIALTALQAAYHTPLGFKVSITKQIKPGSGLGSSAASAAGAVIAANKLLGNYFSKEQLLEFALEGEAAASGSKHADNIAPLIYGGFTLIYNQNSFKIAPLNYPNLFVSIAHPQIEVKTMDARRICKKHLQLKTAIMQWGNVGGLIAGLEQHNYNLIKMCLNDHVIEPTRKLLIPGFDDIKKQSLALGALGGGISGSGPAIFMLNETAETAHKVTNNMAQFYKNLHVDCHVYTTEVNAVGAQEILN